MRWVSTGPRKTSALTETDLDGCISQLVSKRKHHDACRTNARGQSRASMKHNAAWSTARFVSTGHRIARAWNDTLVSGCGKTLSVLILTISYCELKYTNLGAQNPPSAPGIA
eukprot:1336610-Rhodomonas_salina.9